MRAGDLFQPQHRRRRNHATRHADRVFATPDRLYAKHYASIWDGDLYRVELVGEWQPSSEDPIESFHAPAARVTEVVDRGVVLNLTERKQLARKWTAAA
ncbi:hypothetical protein ACFXG4_04045 [Nocardia sp. NPDC059246]|uniref:hypothetical protein n=1 Tax=unclassified Nocardia TaxID=2637762 RepID=UPI0036BC3EC4